MEQQEVIILIEEMFMLPIEQAKQEVEEAKRIELGEKYGGNIEFVKNEIEMVVSYIPVLLKK